jgi:hypothetical protein
MPCSLRARMDFAAICTGLGLALAVGLIIGVIVPPIVPAWGAFVAAAPLGVLAVGAALNGADEEIWPALLLGPAAAGGAALITRDVVGGAARRAQPTVEDVRAQTPAGVAAIVVVAAAVIAVLSLVLWPVSLVVLAAFIWLWASRRRQAERKHEGLRVLR